METTEQIVPQGTQASEAVTPLDPFTLDEVKFASLSPEQRASLEPVIEEWKTRAKSEIEKSGKTYEEKYRPHMEKAEALDNLVQNPQFQQWWNSIQAQATSQNPQAAGAIAETKPQDFASPQEWQQAILDASNGDSTKMRDIQARMWATMATPVVQQLRQGQEELRTTLEMKDLFERHADAKKLDSIGRDASNPNDRSLSLLEMALNWATENGKTLEDGYQMARKWADASKVEAQREAMGMVQEKKESVTSGPSTIKGGQTVVEVADQDELISKNMEYVLNGQKPPRFVIRNTASDNSKSRWAQKT